MKKIHVFSKIVLLCALGLIVLPAAATISLVAEGTSAKGVDVRFEADLTIVGDMLTIELTNNSPVDSLNPDDLLGSFYFDIVDGDGLRPVLTYESATGDTYQGVKDEADVMLGMDADLMAMADGAGSWQYKVMDDASNPFLGFGIGTVGNSNLSPNGFDGNIVGGIDYAIYKGEITSQSLTNADVLVKDSAVFVFSGLTGFSEADISGNFAFGLGTAPDSLLVPEPATMLLLGLGGLVLRRKR